MARKNNVELLIGGKPVDCKNGLKVGNYDNVNIHFCPPNLEDFLRSQSISRKSWDEVIGVQVRVENEKNTEIDKMTAIFQLTL